MRAARSVRDSVRRVCVCVCVFCPAANNKLIYFFSWLFQIWGL